MFSAALAMFVCGCLHPLLTRPNWPSIADTFTINFLGLGERCKRGVSLDMRRKGAMELTVRVCRSSDRGTSSRPRVQEFACLRSTCCPSSSNLPRGKKRCSEVRQTSPSLRDNFAGGSARSDSCCSDSALLWQWPKLVESGFCSSSDFPASLTLLTSKVVQTSLILSASGPSSTAVASTCRYL